MFTHSSLFECREQYDTIWGAVLMFNQKLIWVGLIYHMEPTPKSGKTEKLKNKKDGHAQNYR